MHAIDDRHRLNPVRITAGAAAIALNAAMLLVLMAPITPPSLDALKEDAIQVVDIIVHRPPPPPPPPIPVPIVQPTPVPVELPRTTPPPLPRQDTMPTSDPVVDPQPGDLPALPPMLPPARDPVATTPRQESGPLTGASLQYASAPAPDYPRDALRRGHSGTVMLEVLVGVDGRPLDVSISRSSGYRSLDIAARRQVLEHWRFRPALHDGAPVQAIGIVPVVFSLD